MTAAYAAEIVSWRYPAPYDCYDMTDVDPGFLASPDSGFFALAGETGLIGFRSFGPDGQVPGGVYDGSALASSRRSASAAWGVSTLPPMAGATRC